MTPEELYFWVAIDPSGVPDIHRMCVLKADCRLTAREKRAGWRVTLMKLTEAEKETAE